MKIGNISEYKFSYKEDANLRFSDHNFVLAIKDEDFPDRNIVPILYNEEGEVYDIDSDDMNRIVVIPHKTIIDKSLSRFNLNEIVKISYGNIYDNTRYFDGSRLPKCATIDSYIYPTTLTDFIEILSGVIYESSSKIKLKDSFLDSLLLELYIENKRPIFIEENNKMFGPFRVLSKDSDGYFNVEKHLWKVFGEYELNDNTYIEFIANDIVRKINIPSFNELKLIKEREFIKDSDILNEFKKRLEQESDILETKNLNNLLNYLNKISKTKSIDDYLQNNQRVIDILRNAENVIISEINLTNIIPEITNIKEEIERLQNDESNIKLAVANISKRKEELQLEIIEKEDRKRKIEEDLQNLVKVKESELNNIKSELQSDIESLQIKKDKIEQDILFETQEKSKELDEIKANISKLKEENEELEYTNTALRQDNKDVQRDSQKELINIFKQKKYFDFINGRDLSEFDNNEEYPDKDFSVTNTYNEYIDFRDDLKSILNQHGRYYESHFIDNLLISIHQNTLTILAGHPGTGKTTLARLLTKNLAPKERVSEVSVSRGWTSQKDLIGFSNPLNNKFHSAPTGVYELLKQLDTESKNQKCLNYPLAYIILDEANLSPIEHYWSVFYNLTDSHASNNNLLSISLGNNCKLNYSNNLRFIATINIDQTTESLSPRVIDRVNIIQLPITNYQINTISNEDIINLSISLKKCIDFFNLADFRLEYQTIQLSDELDTIYNEIKKQFKALRLIISPRVEIGIKRYCSVAQKLMTKEIALPLDYCVAQRLLPMINVQGDSAKLKLDELLNILKEYNLKQSTSILEKIIRTGEDDSFFEGNYNYFLTMSHA